MMLNLITNYRYDSKTLIRDPVSVLIHSYCMSGAQKWGGVTKYVHNNWCMFIVQMVCIIPCYLWLSFNMGVSFSESSYNPKKTKGSKGVLTSLCVIKVKEPPFCTWIPPFILKNTFV